MASSAPALDLVPAMASVRSAPSPSPLALEVKEVEEKERSWPPPMKLPPYAMYRVFRGMGSAGDDILFAAYVWMYMEFDPSKKKKQQQQAEAASSELLLPLPPPEMDMC